MAVKLNTKGKSHANGLINSGDVDKTSSWSFSADDGNKILGDPPDWAEYGKWFLGTDDAEPMDTKAHYKYPFGKNGKAYRSGLVAIRQRAAQQNATDIYDAAGMLIDKIDGEEKARARNNWHEWQKNAKARFQKDEERNASGPWFKVDKEQDEATVYIYDDIAWYAVSAEEFVKELNSITSPTIHLRINSFGGEVFAGHAISNAIKNHKSKIIAHVDGLAASIASVIAIAADETHMGENAMLMIHEAWSIVIGYAKDMRAEADLLDKLNGVITKTYSDKTGIAEDEVRNYMSAETWFTAQEAVDLGFADKIEESGKKKKEHTGEKEEPTKRDLEKALRDAGCSSKLAKSILADGYNDGQRDVDRAEEPSNVIPMQRDVAPEPNSKRDKIVDLLIRAEMVAPGTHR